MPSDDELRRGAPGLRCLAVPRRVQLGDVGCGLYALGMLMDYWHSRQALNDRLGLGFADTLADEATERDHSNRAAAGSSDGRDDVAATVMVALVKPMDSTVGAQNATHFSVEPNTPELLLSVSQRLGYTRYGETYAAAHLCEVAKYFGYSARLHKTASLRMLLDLIDKGHPPIVCVDIDLTTFQPAANLRGQHTHFVVVEGYFGAQLSSSAASACDEYDRVSGRRSDDQQPPSVPQFLLVKQSGSRAPTPTVWSVETFLASWCGNGWEGRYRKRAMPREVANRIAVCRADGRSWTALDREGPAGLGDAAAVRLDSSRPAMGEKECAEVWEEGVNLGILESAHVASDANGPTEPPSTVPGCDHSTRICAQSCISRATP